MRFSNRAKNVFSIAAASLFTAALVMLPACSIFDDEDVPDQSGSSYESSVSSDSLPSDDESVVSSRTEPDSGYETVSKSYVYNAWYDVEKDNPVDYTSIDSNDAYALKCVFYFDKPVNGSFRAILNKDGKQVSVKNIRLDGKVVCECDFSAGLEGRGTFETGTYTVSLETEGRNVAVSGDMRVN
jgi:hypothetical protein